MHLHPATFVRGLVIKPSTKLWTSLRAQFSHSIITDSQLRWEYQLAGKPLAVEEKKKLEKPLFFHMQNTVWWKTNAAHTSFIG